MRCIAAVLPAERLTMETPGESQKLRPKVTGKIGRRVVRIGDREYCVDFNVADSLQFFPPNWIHRVAIYVAGRFAPEARLGILRAIAREQGWTVTGVFVDETEDAGPELQRLLEAEHNVRQEAILQWVERCEFDPTVVR